MRSLVILAITALAAAQAGPKVTILNGTVQGAKCPQSDINYFYSIPYALPPVGDLRFTAPQSYNKTFDNKILDATKAPPACPQFGTLFVSPGPQDENCLFINVYAPATAQEASKLPVKVWIHGGADAAGGIADPLYNGCYSANDSILVSVAYRLGPLGFLALEAAGLTGNYGIQDQLLALQWVQENIGHFGGDKDKVVLFGQSAGAWDAWAIATLPQAKSLIKAAVLESGAGPDYPTLAETKKFYENYVTQLNCSVSDVGCLRSKTPTELNNTFKALPSNGTPFVFSLLSNMGRGPSWTPIVDGTILPVQPSAAGLQVPSIVGTNTFEGTVFALSQYQSGSFNLSQTQYNSLLTYNFGPFADAINSTFSLDKFSKSPAPAFYAISNVITQFSFFCPAYRALIRGASNGVPVYTYSFNHTPSCPFIPGLPAMALPFVMASHTAELPFVFGTVDATSPQCNYTSAEQQLGAYMRAAWTSMAATGTPGSNWPLWTANASEGVIFNNAPVVGKVDYSVCAKFWNQINSGVFQLDANLTATANTTNGTMQSAGVRTTASAVGTFAFGILGVAVALVLGL